MPKRSPASGRSPFSGAFAGKVMAFCAALRSPALRGEALSLLCKMNELLKKGLAAERKAEQKAVLTSVKDFQRNQRNPRLKLLRFLCFFVANFVAWCLGVLVVAFLA
jgi:hypothetical protein